MLFEYANTPLFKCYSTNKIYLLTFTNNSALKMSFNNAVNLNIMGRSESLEIDKRDLEIRKKFNG